MPVFDTSWRDPFPGLPFAPRDWQVEALDAVLDAFSHDDPPACIVRAVMGAGKSVLQANLAVRAAAGKHYDRDVVVVTAPTRALVSQLAATIHAACSQAFMVDAVDRLFAVREWHADARQLADIVVSTHASLPALETALFAERRSVRAWIADEAHRTNQPTVRAFADNVERDATIGFTATPYLADRRDGLVLFEREVYAYDAAKALGDGVVVPWRITHARHDGEVDAVCLDWVASRLARLPDEPGIVNADTVDDARYFARMLAGHTERAVEVVTGDMPACQREKVFDEFRLGVVPVLVHVNVMVEGVDLPNVRWMCLRRRVASRVRFAQEVGRGLRASPGKTHCELFDPHDLFGVHSLSIASAIGEGLPRDSVGADLARAVELWKPGAQGVLFAREIQAPTAAVMRPVMRAVRRLRVAISTHTPVESRVGSWRSKPATAKQLTLVRDTARKLLKTGAVTPWGADVATLVLLCGRWARTPTDMNKGQASDILDVVFNMHRIRDVDACLALANGG